MPLARKPHSPLMILAPSTAWHGDVIPQRGQLRHFHHGGAGWRGGLWSQTGNAASFYVLLCGVACQGRENCVVLAKAAMARRALRFPNFFTLFDAAHALTSLPVAALPIPEIYPELRLENVR